MTVRYVCDICTNNFHSPQDMGVTNCGHTGCKNCLTAWITTHRHRTCPTCRTKVRNWHPFYVNVITDDASSARSATTSTSNPRQPSDSTSSVFEAVTAMENLEARSSTSKIDEVQELVEQSLGTLQRSGIDVQEQLLQAIHDFVGRITPRLHDLETYKRKLDEKRKQMSRINQHYAEKIAENERLMYAREQLREKLEEATRKLFEAENERDKVVNQRDTAMAQATEAIHERDKARTELAKIPSMQALHDEVNKYKKISEDSKLRATKYKAENKQLKEEISLIKIKHEVVSNSANGVPKNAERDEEENWGPASLQKGDANETYKELHVEDGDLVTLSDDEDELLYEPLAKRQKIELLDDPASGPPQKANRSGRPSLFVSSHPLPARLITNAPDKATLQRSNSGNLPFKLDAHGRLQGTVVLGRKNKRKVG